MNTFTTFSIQFDNQGLSVSTWLGDFNLPAHTVALIAVGVLVLRIRKIILSKKTTRKTVKK